MSLVFKWSWYFWPRNHNLTEADQDK